MALPAKKYYKGAPANALLTSSPSAGDTTMTVDTITGWPTSFPFYVVIDPGTSKEEKVRVTAISTLTLTVVRAQDNTTAVGHNSGAAIYPVFTAIEASEANEVASIMTTKGDLITNDGSTINRLAVGATNTHVLQVDSTATNGIKWGQVATAGIADGAVTSAKILDGTIAKDDLSSTLLKLICPVGTISAYSGATAPTGWLLCNGTSTSGYTELAALVGATTPDLTGKFLLGKTSTGTGSTLLGSGGSKTIAEANLPSHSHGLNSHTHTIDHNHTASGSHNHTTSGVGIYDSGSNGVWGLIATSATGNLNANIQSTVASPTGSATVDLDNFTGNSGGPSTANTTATGSGTDYYQPFVAVSYIIKHDY